MNPQYPLDGPPDPEVLGLLADRVETALVLAGLPSPTPSDMVELRQHLGEFLWGRV